MKFNSGIATVIMMGIIFVSCIACGYLAERYLTPDEAAEVEEELEGVAENEMEEMVKAPKGSLKNEADAFFPKSKQT